MMAHSESFIFLVEDNPNDEKLTLLSLRENKILNDVVVARDGAEAIKMLQEMERLPQLILLDLKLPKVDGLEVLKFIRSTEKTKALPVVIFTSSSEQSDLFNSYNLGVNSYVQKPVEFENFLQAVNRLGIYWLLLNRTPGPK